MVGPSAAPPTVGHIGCHLMDWGMWGGDDSGPVPQCRERSPPLEVGPEGLVQADVVVGLLRHPEEVDHAAKKGPPWSDDLARVVEEADKGLPLASHAGPAVSPPRQRLQDASHFVFRQMQDAGMCVVLNAQEDDAGCRAVQLIHSERHAPLGAGVEDCVEMRAAHR